MGKRKLLSQAFALLCLCDNKLGNSTYQSNF